MELRALARVPEAQAEACGYDKRQKRRQTYSCLTATTADGYT